MSKDSKNKTEAEEIADKVMDTDDEEVKALPEEEPEEKINMIKVSDLQPKRTKPGYPQELKNNLGFGYNPSNK